MLTMKHLEEAREDVAGWNVEGVPENQYTEEMVDKMLFAAEKDFKEQHNELVLRKAQAEGAQSLLLDVQQECIDQRLRADEASRTHTKSGWKIPSRTQCIWLGATIALGIAEMIYVASIFNGVFVCL